jgi:hypothetical protein
MVNYYSQFHKLKESLGVHTLSLDDFEKCMIRFYGFGLDRTIHKWLSNFEKAGLIKVTREGGGVWMVSIL